MQTTCGVVIDFKRPRTTPPQAHRSRERYVGPVQDFTQLCAAFRLVHDSYVALGYMPPHPSGMRYSIYELLPTTTTFAAVEEGALVGTVTTVLDSLAGLPLQSAFGDRLDQLRAGGATVAEATMFACAHSRLTQASQAYLTLMQYAFSWCCLYGTTDLCIVVNPCHRTFWQKAVGFEAIEEARGCRHVGNAPGVLLRLDIRAALSGSVPLTRCMQKIKEAPIDARLFIDNYLINDAEMALLLHRNPGIAAGLARHQRIMMARYFPVALRAAEGAQRA